MAAGPIIDPEQFLHEQLAQASPDLMRELLGTFINSLLSAQADAVCGADYGTRTETRSNRRNGYRHRDLDTRVGTLDVANARAGASGAAKMGRIAAALGSGHLVVEDCEVSIDKSAELSRSVADQLSTDPISEFAWDPQRCAVVLTVPSANDALVARVRQVAVPGVERIILNVSNVVMTPASR